MYSGQTKKGEEKEARRKNGGNGNRKNGKEQELDLAADSSDDHLHYCLLTPFNA